MRREQCVGTATGVTLRTSALHNSYFFACLYILHAFENKSGLQTYVISFAEIFCVLHKATSCPTVMKPQIRIESPCSTLTLDGKGD